MSNKGKTVGLVIWGFFFPLYIYIYIAFVHFPIYNQIFLTKYLTNY